MATSKRKRNPKKEAASRQIVPKNHDNQNHFEGGYPFYWKLLLILIASAICIGIIWIIGLTLDEELVGTCNRSPYQRKSNPDVTQTALIPSYIRDLLAFGVIRCILFYLSIKILRNSSA